MNRFADYFSNYVNDDTITYIGNGDISSFTVSRQNRELTVGVSFDSFVDYAVIDNAKTVIDVAQARGVITLSAQNYGVDIFEYTPLQVKQAVVGYGRAEKKQVQEMTRLMLGLAKIPKPDDTADALAMAICHGHCSGSIMGKLNSLK